MKKIVAMVAVTVFVFACSATAFAQEKGLGHVGDFGLFVRNADAVKALHLTADQEKQFDEAVKTLKEKLGDGPKEAGKAKGEFTASVKKILTPNQFDKARTLAFQASGGLKASKTGAGAAGSLFALEALNISPEQKTSIQEIQKKTMAAVKEAGDSEEGKKKVEVLRKEQVEEVVKLLTPDQKKAAEKLIDDTPDFLKPKHQPKQEGKKAGKKEK